MSASASAPTPSPWAGGWNDELAGITRGQILLAVEQIEHW